MTSHKEVCNKKDLQTNLISMSMSFINVFNVAIPISRGEKRGRTQLVSLKNSKLKLSLAKSSPGERKEVYAYIFADLLSIT